MTTLQDRVESAGGPDREFDRDIALLLGEYDQPEDMGCFLDPAEAVVGGGGQTYAPPAYTASLDAAMTLVPEGFWWSIVQNGEKGFDAACQNRGEALSWTTAATPALALCAAALRAGKD